MRVLVCLAMVACGSDDPEIGGVDWSAMPSTSVPTSLFTLAYSTWGSETVVIKSIDHDGSLHCSEAKEIGGHSLRIELTNAAVAGPGDVPITAGPLQPGVPAALFDLGSPSFDGGSLTITDVDGTVRATFRATAPGVVVTGVMNAVRCD